MGGTTFAEGTGKYWSSTNQEDLTSALSYIPEVAGTTQLREHC